MKRFYFLATILTVASGCSSFHQNTAYNVWEESSPPKRSPASVISLGVPTFQNYDITFSTETVKLCGHSFDKISLKSSHPDYIITPKWIEDKSLPFRYPLPDSLINVGEEDKSVLLRAGRARFVAIKNPLFPDIPNLTTGKETETCEKLTDYHQNFFKVFTSKKHDDTESVKVLSKGFELHNAVSYLSRHHNRDNYDLVVYPYDSIIIYDDLYQKEVEDIARVHRRSGYTPKLLKLSKLPGLDSNGTVPEECSGDYLKECYQISSAQKKEHSPHIPGLIKAYLRTEKKKTNLKGVFLIGNQDNLGSFYESDIFYMLPDLKTNSPKKYTGDISESEQIKNYQLNDVIPVGRLVTQNDLQGKKDPRVADYARKIHHWHENLPIINTWSLFETGSILGVSFEEQLLTINAYLNKDHSYTSSDNYYNIKFMTKMRIARNSCGAIGEALRQTVYEMIKKKTDGAGNWQLMNRQFQGSPLNLIAKYPNDCQKISQSLKEKNELIGQR